MKKINLSFLLILSLQLTSCLSGSDYYRDRIEPFLKDLKPNYKPQVYDGVMEPEEFPDLIEDQKTLEGIDSNKDGVRDDLEIFINRNFNTWIERDNLKNTVRRAPEFYKKYKTMTVRELIIHSSNYSVDKNCIWSGLRRLNLKSSPELLRYNALDAIYNTKNRESAYNYNYQRLAGEAYGDGYGDSKIMDKCSEKIDNELKKKNGSN